MERVYSCEHPLTAQHIKNLLINENIQCIVKNEAVQSAVGEVPPIAAWPEIWIVDSQDKEKAKALIKSHVEAEASLSTEEWQCENCNETNDGNFNICWNCNSSK